MAEQDSYSIQNDKCHVEHCHFVRVYVAAFALVLAANAVRVFLIIEVCRVNTEPANDV